MSKVVSNNFLSLKNFGNSKSSVFPAAKICCKASSSVTISAEGLSPWYCVPKIKTYLSNFFNFVIPKCLPVPPFCQLLPFHTSRFEFSSTCAVILPSSSLTGILGMFIPPF